MRSYWHRYHGIDPRTASTRVFHGEGGHPAAGGILNRFFPGLNSAYDVTGRPMYLMNRDGSFVLDENGSVIVASTGKPLNTPHPYGGLVYNHDAYRPGPNRPQWWPGEYADRPDDSFRSIVRRRNRRRP